MTELTPGPHADLSAPQSSGSSSFRFGPNTPFLFHATAPLPPARKWEPYDPQRWAGTDFGMGSATSVVDVDMDGAEAEAESAAQGAGAGEAVASASSASGEPGDAPASPCSKPKPKGKPKPRKKATVEDDDDGEERHIATGAIARVRRRRKEWARRRGADEHDLAPGATYNLHLGPNGTQHRDIPGILLG